MFINETDFFGVVINGLSSSITGDLNLTLIMIFFLVLVITLTFSIPMEYVAPFLLPLLLVCMFVSAEFFAIGVVFAFLIGLTIMRLWFL